MPEAPPQPTSAILDLEKAIDEFRQDVLPLIDPDQEENWDGVKLKSKERAILQAGLRLVGHCIAILIYQLVLSQSVQMAANLRAIGKAGLHYTSEGYKEVAIMLIGGVEVRVPTLYKLARRGRKGAGRKKKRGKRGKSQGQGFYPVLVLLGISERTTPLVRCYVTQAATQAPSFEQARPVVAWLGLDFSQSRIRRISEAFCQVGLAVRAKRLARFAAGQRPAGTALKGKRVALAVDGGRLNIRQTRRKGRKRKSGWPGYETDWQEPKLLIIYVLDEEGRKVSRTDMPVVADGTLMGLDEFMKILEMHLHQLGVAQAESIVLLGDGAQWIWHNVPALLLRLGCRPEQITQILDNCHATQHLYKLGEALFGATAGKAWAKKWAKQLKKGKAKALVSEIKYFLNHQKSKDQKTAQTEYTFFLKHLNNSRLDYAYFKEQKLPIGSGVVESLIRQVVNIRLKSCSKAWLVENAEAFLHARCQWAVHQWSDFCDTVLTFGLLPLSSVKL
jgi:hypothetical protein